MAKKINAIEIRWAEVFEYDFNLIILKEAKNFFRNKKNEHDQLFRQQKKSHSQYTKWCWRQLNTYSYWLVATLVT